MKKFVLVPDSFKGTMTSIEICNIMKQSIISYFPMSKVVSLPVADGGEGSVDSFLSAMGGKKIHVTVSGPYGKDMESFYGVVNNGKTAVIEMASCAGLPLIDGNLHPDKTTTYGVGQLIVHAVTHGCEEIIVGLGGSCTNDAGTGAAAAAGIKFIDENGRTFVPVGGTLSNIRKIDFSGLCPALKGVRITAMSDINNPLYGQNGAAYIFGAQKGADEKMIELLDNGLKNISGVIGDTVGKDVSQIPGSGAAGGMGAGMLAFFDARLRMGIDVVLDTVGFDGIAKDADMIFTGEGKLDSQSLHGKVVAGVAQRAKKIDKPVVAIVGDIGDSIEPIYDMGVSAVFSINRVAVDFEKARERSKNDLKLTMNNLMLFLSGLYK